MEKPKVIYVPIETSMLTRKQQIRYDLASTEPVRFADENIKYARVDDLLDWAKEIYERYQKQDKEVPHDSTKGWVSAFGAVIEKLNDLK